MKRHAHKSDAKKIEEHTVSTFYDYELPFKNAAVGVSEIRGRYPQTGFDIDTEIDQTWYVEQGRGHVWVENETYELHPGSMIMIPKGEKYWIDGEDLRLVVISSPPWFVEQHKHVEE